MLEPTLETLAADTRATIAKVDVDEHQGLAAQYQVRGVPTVVIYSDGEAVEQFSGVRGEDELRGLIRQYA
jgi:thioredoxin 1